MPPPDAVIVTLVLPAGTCALAVRVKVLDIVPTGIVTGEKAAVNHDGSPDAVSDTGKLNPPLTLNCTVVVTFAPALTDTVAGDKLIWNDGVDVLASLQCPTITAASTDPSPVAGSYPVPAAYPAAPGTLLLPAVTSWNTAAPPPACFVASVYSAGFAFPIRAADRCTVNAIRPANDGAATDVPETV